MTASAKARAVAISSAPPNPEPCGVREGLERARISQGRSVLALTVVDAQLGRANDDLASGFFQGRA